MKKVPHLLFAIICFFCAYSLQVFGAESMAERPEVKVFIEEMVKKHDFDRDILNTLFSYVYSNNEVIVKLNKPYEAKPWYTYRDFFLTKARIEKGAQYWNEHAKMLETAEKQYGVPAKIIVAIIGVETSYGETKGNYPVLSTLATLSFDNFRRTKFFRDEMTQFLLLTREQHLKPLSIKGSYAGAIGLPQFMPSSYRQYAVDFNQKGYTDLMNNHEDAIASVANYLQKHGWQTGKSVAIKASVLNDQYLSLTHKSLKPKLTQADLTKFGISPSQTLPEEKVSFIQLQGKDAKEFWLGLQNFYVISTYNKSEQYVMAVNLLADKIAELHTH